MGSHVVQGTTWATYRDHIRASIDTLNVFHNSLGCQLAECREQEGVILKQIADLHTELDRVRIEIIELEREDHCAKLTQDVLTAFCHTTCFQRNLDVARDGLHQQTSIDCRFTPSQENRFACKSSSMK